MKEVVLYFDGGIRQELMAGAYVAVDVSDNNTILFKGAKLFGSGTSNLAEYQALIIGLNACRDQNVEKVNIIGDSQLIIKQITGAFQAKAIKLRNKRDEVLELLKSFKDYSIKWVKRQNNKLADSLVGQLFSEVLGDKRNHEHK